jgi:hypothetical protein
MAVIFKQDTVFFGTLYKYCVGDTLAAQCKVIAGFIWAKIVSVIQVGSLCIFISIITNSLSNLSTEIVRWMCKVWQAVK